MAARKRPLVEEMRNVSTFLSQPEVKSEASTNTIAIDKIQLPPKQPRRYFDPEKLAQLVQSIQEHGILEPLLVRPLPDGNVELVAGERRLRAAQTLELAEVPIVSKSLSDREALQVALMENLQREDLNPIEETEALLELLAIALDLQQEDVVSLLNRANHAKNRNQQLEDNVILQLNQVETVLSAVGRFTAESFRANRLPLLNLPDDVLEALRQGKLEYTKARAIARLKNDTQRQQLLTTTLEEDLSLSQLKERIAAVAQPVQSTQADTAQPVPLKNRVDDAYRRIRKSSVWDNPKKQKKLEKLLAELEALVSDE